MAATQAPNLGLYQNWAYGEDLWHTGMDVNLRTLDALVLLVVLSASTDIPAAPSDGDRYIIPADATGAWTGKTGQITRYIDSAWEYYAPSVGWTAHVQDTGVRVIYDGAVWSRPAESVTLKTGTVIEDYSEPTATTTGTISRADGAWQVLTLSASATLDVSALTAGQSVTITVVGGDEYALTYSGVGRWSGAGQPTELMAKHDLTFAHNGIEIVAFDLGGSDAV